MSGRDETDILVEDFVCGRVSPQAFDHDAHVRVGWGLLRRMAFLDALTQFAGVIRRMTEAVGAPEKFNLTITVAFLSLIDEARRAQPDADWQAFKAANGALWDKALLKRWYDGAQLHSAAAKRSFVLPQARGA